MKHLKHLFVVVCCWKFTAIIEGQLAVAERGGCGSVNDMVKTEASKREPGEVFLRECAASVSEMKLAWEQVVLFKKGDR